MSRPARAPTGLLLIDKPGGITSHDAVASRSAGAGHEEGRHAGTLDPMATGPALMGVGRATRLLRFLGDLAKTYEGTVRLGVETDTLDADGAVRARRRSCRGHRATPRAMSALCGRLDADAPRRTRR